MTYAAERLAIETYLAAQWGSTTPILFDAHGGEAVANSIRLVINSGAVLQGSIGRTSNRLEFVGVAQILIHTAAGLGSAAWRGYAETLAGIFREARLTTAGVAITTAGEEFIRFSPAGQHPYISGTQTEPSLMTTTFNAPFIRYGTS